VLQVLIFSQFVIMLDVIEDYLELSGGGQGGNWGGNGGGGGGHLVAGGRAGECGERGGLAWPKHRAG
jgi:hypothetical protein